VRIRIGTRGSRLALIQTEIVIGRLRRASDAEFEVVHITTKGDINRQASIDSMGEGIFEKEVNRALQEGEVDMAVHSLKDVPLDLPPSITLGAVPDRAPPNDVLFSPRYRSIAELPPLSQVGTSSSRRRAQLLSARRDVRAAVLRGNVETRVQKVMAGQYAAALMAEAGLARLGVLPSEVGRLSVEEFPTSPGQGAIAVYIRGSDHMLAELLSKVNSPIHEAEVTAEREFLRALGGGCASPVGCTVTRSPEGLRMVAGMYAPDGSTFALRSFEGSTSDPTDLGRRAAATMLKDDRVKSFWVRKA